MARKTSDRAKQSQNGVSNNGGSGEGNGAANSASGSGTDPSGDSGDGGGGGSGDVIRPTLDGAGNGNGDGDGRSGSDEPRRGRGRPRGSTGGQKKAEISVTTLAEVIAFAHVGIATVFKNDAWSLDDGEAKRLAEASAKILKHHDTPAFSAYAMDWIGLIMVAGNIYGPRIAVTFTRQPTPDPRRPQATTRQEPKTPRAEQDEGYVTITDPLGSGSTMRVPVAN